MAELLVVELLGGIGDTLLALPAVHAIARAHPADSLRLLTFQPADELVRGDPLVAEVVGVPAGADARAAVAAQLDRVPPDVAVSTTTHSGIGELLRARVPSTVTDLWCSPPAAEQVGERFVRLLAAAGLVPVPDQAALRPRLHLAAEEVAAVRPMLPETGALVLVPATGMAVKRWPGSRWQALAAAWPGPVVSVAERVPGARLLPALSLRGLAALLAVAAERGGVCVGVDTGPLRLASSVGCPAVALHGPTVAGRYGLNGPADRSPQGLPGCPVRVPADFTTQECWWDAGCPLAATPACMADLAVDAVLAAAQLASVG